MIEGDPDALKTLLANLIDNAIRYTPAGGRVDVTVERGRRRRVIAVRDNGPGIPDTSATACSSASRAGLQPDAPGSGLGLAIVKRIAERHAGTRRARRRARRQRASASWSDCRRPALREP